MVPTTSAPNISDLLHAGQSVDGFGSVTGTPGLPDTFSGTFSSRLVRVGDVRHHVVVGGTGAPLLLLGGWPQFWYQWRLIMPALARDYTVIAVDPRGTGLSDKPSSGYDSGSLAADMHRLMDVLGLHEFSVVSHDVGGWTAYAMAVDEPNRIARLVIADTLVPGLSPSPPLIGDDKINSLLWHYPFNRVSEVNERLVSGREDVYFGHQFATKAASPDAIPSPVVDIYVRALRSPGALHASFEFYRSLDESVAQNERRKKTSIKVPVLGISSSAIGLDVAGELSKFADNVAAKVLRGGHFIAEENPVDFLQSVQQFLSSE